MKYEVLPEMEKASRYGKPSAGAMNWYWAEIDSNTRERTGNSGYIRALTEMEALDRLREAFPDINRIKWINVSQY